MVTSSPAAPAWNSDSGLASGPRRAAAARAPRRLPPASSWLTASSSRLLPAAASASSSLESPVAHCLEALRAAFSRFFLPGRLRRRPAWKWQKLHWLPLRQIWPLLTKSQGLQPPLLCSAEPSVARSLTTRAASSAASARPASDPPASASPLKLALWEVSGTTKMEFSCSLTNWLLASRLPKEFESPIFSTLPNNLWSLPPRLRAAIPPVPFEIQYLGVGNVGPKQPEV
mmetsp:Transcript_172916/g.420639  ORF Transcript_172916/g.420639 Transcript_172916/m.420639 type:complete len:229 (+) Transcript_172916:2314-3000(+)